MKLHQLGANSDVFTGFNLSLEMVSGNVELDVYLVNGDKVNCATPVEGKGSVKEEFVGAIAFKVKSYTSVYVNGSKYLGTEAFHLTGDSSVIVNGAAPCLASGTLVTLADGTKKPIEEIGYGDDLMVHDFDRGVWTSAKPVWVKRPQVSKSYWRTVLSDGTVLKTVGPKGHRLLDVEAGQFRYDTECVGRVVKTVDGFATVVSCDKVDEVVEFYNVITATHMNVVANGVVTSSSRNNLYPIRDMRFVKDERAVRTIDEFIWPSAAAKKFFTGCRLYETIDPADVVNSFIMQKWMTDLDENGGKYAVR